MTSKFGSGAPKCAICAKSVYPVEKVRAIDQDWHKACFKCGGTNGDGCKKTLTMDNYVDHGNMPYCKNCYGRLFGPKGYGVGVGAGIMYPTLSSPNDSIESKIPTATNQVATTAPTPASNAPTKATPAPPMRQAFISSTSASRSATSRLGEGAPKCTLCEKSVYAAEKVEAVGRIWHKQCFICGGTCNDGGCKKKLTLDSYVTHDVDPYCNPCHKRLFGPRGFGYGIGAGVMYPSNFVKATDATANTLIVDHTLPTAPELVTEEEHVPVAEEEQAPATEEEQEPFTEERQVPITEEKQVPIIENEQLPATEDEQLPANDDEQVLAEDEQAPVNEDEQVPAIEEEQEASGPALTKSAEEEYSDPQAVEHLQGECEA